MHSYSTRNRKWTHVYLALFSVLLAWAWGGLLGWLEVSIPWWFDSPAIFGFFALIEWLHNKYLWRCRLFQFLSRTRTPDLNGKWCIELKSSYDDFNSIVIGEAEITQSWSDILIVLRFKKSNSESYLASLYIFDGKRPELSYLYRNQPIPSAVDSMNEHHGTAVLEYISEPDILKGRYYSGRSRTNFGEMTLTRKDPQ